MKAKLFYGGIVAAIVLAGLFLMLWRARDSLPVHLF